MFKPPFVQNLKAHCESRLEITASFCLTRSAITFTFFPMVNDHWSFNFSGRDKDRNAVTPLVPRSKLVVFTMGFQHNSVQTMCGEHCFLNIRLYFLWWWHRNHQTVAPVLVSGALWRMHRIVVELLHLPEPHSNLWLMSKNFVWYLQMTKEAVFSFEIRKIGQNLLSNLNLNVLFERG